MWKCTRLIIPLLLCPNHNIFAQTASVDTLYNQSYEWGAGQRATIPEWVFSSQQEGKVIGISDPCMNPEAARMQALQRAAYLYSLQRSTHLKLLSDFFSSTETASNTYEDTRDKILALGVIEQPFLKCAYQIEKEYTSMFGERFIQVSFVQADSCNLSYHSMSELMFLFTKERVEEEEIRFNLLLESSVSPSEQPFQAWYQLKGPLASPEIFSCINGVFIRPLQEDYWYEDRGFSENQKNSVRIDMKNAFWNAYMTSFVKAILFYPFPTVNVKKVDDNLNGRNDSNRGLHREKVMAALSIVPFIKEIRNNQLYVDWQITEQQN